MMEKNGDDDFINRRAEDLAMKKFDLAMKKFLSFFVSSILIYWTGWVAFGLAGNLAP
jgi:hypothetical protein